MLKSGARLIYNLIHALQHYSLKVPLSFISGGAGAWKLLQRMLPAENGSTKAWLEGLDISFDANQTAKM